MPDFCCVSGCGSRAERDPVKFFRIPKELKFKYKTEKNNLSAERRQKWLNAINRKDWIPGKTATVCSKHFVSGRPSTLMDVNDLDWVPCLSLGYTCPVKEKSSADLEREIRKKEALQIISHPDVSSSSQVLRRTEIDVSISKNNKACTCTDQSSSDVNELLSASSLVDQKNKIQ